VKTKILIVDDYAENIHALSELIASDDIEILTAPSGDAALDLLYTNEVDLAMLDVQMPGMTGFELARLVRGVRKYRHLPIIFVTAQQQDRSVIFEGYETGAVDLLFKPLDPHVVRSKVRAFVEISQQRMRMRDHVDELERLKLQAESANLAKSEAEKTQSFDAVRRNGQLLMRLIDDILDFSKIEAGKLEFENNQFDLCELFADVETSLAFRAKEKGISLVFSKKGERFTGYNSDPIRIKQIFLNVIGNAIKFTHKGEVTAELNVQSVSPQMDRVSLRVTDQGVGVSPDQAERLFRPFGQADASTRRQFGGSGLGLVISREIARAMGGELKLVHSQPGKGSTFEVTLNVERAIEGLLGVAKVTSDPKVSGSKKSDLSGKEILIVDDAPDNLTLIELFLAETKARLSFANNGYEAIEKVTSKKFDLILMDIQMPGKDGHETTEEIRQMGFSKPIIALTAHAIKSEHLKCLDSGCNAVMSKPLDRAKLIDLISANLL
jgi:CheY-like chemotaxis protein